MLPAVLINMRERYPRIMITIRTMASSAVPGVVLQGGADLGFAFSVNQNSELQQLAQASFAIGAVVTPSHPLATKPFVTFDECARFPLILTTSDASLSPAIQALRRRAQELESPIIDARAAAAYSVAQRPAVALGVRRLCPGRPPLAARGDDLPASVRRGAAELARSRVTRSPAPSRPTNGNLIYISVY
jgi:hypothetical protein